MPKPTDAPHGIARTHQANQRLELKQRSAIGQIKCNRRNKRPPKLPKFGFAPEKLTFSYKFF
jgi:hypothetical protein